MYERERVCGCASVWMRAERAQIIAYMEGVVRYTESGCVRRVGEREGGNLSIGEKGNVR